MGRFDALTQIEKIPSKDVPPPSEEPTNQYASLLANQQVSKESKKQINKEIKKQTSKETNQYPSKSANSQTIKPTNHQTTKEKKKYGTYLREDSILAIQLLAVQTKSKDHEILQEAVDQFFVNLKK
jgi:hypothetical protein